MDQSKQTKSLKDIYFQEGSYKKKLAQEFSIAGVANVVTRTLLAPLQRWKIISQVQSAYPLRPKKFKGFFDYLKRVPKQQGAVAFWRGNLLNCWIYFYQAFFQIVFYDNINSIKKIWLEQSQELPWLQNIQQNLIIPTLTAMQALLVIYPLDTYRIHTTMSYHKKKQNAQFTKFRHFVSSLENIRDLYRGFPIAVLMSVIQFNFVYNLTGVFSKLKNDNIDNTIPQIVTPQMIASIVGIAFLHPLDTFRKIFQFNNMYRPQIFTGYRSVFARLKQKNSYSSLYNGFTVSLVKTAMFIPMYWFILGQWTSFSLAKKSEQIQNI